jgi:hypothetical protein
MTDEAQSRQPDKSKWPPEVRTIFSDEADFLGIDGKGHLYWDGRRIATDLKFTFWQRAAAAIATASLAATGLNDGVQLLQRLGLIASP